MYRALYRKWRPQRFEDVVGQRAIVAALKNQITAGRVGHAYLFTGVRGTGKTSCAKIFAKAVNCLHPQNGDPCGECEVCRGIDNGTILDVVEMDAASNNSVDDIRDLRDETAYTPSTCTYKVYIIDEVHMLSTSAFNALLKTLEEPPAHVIFILATTEIQKVPATILSRCQRYDFTRIGPEDIAARVVYIAEQEGLALTSGGADLIARLADGALRDALSILDTCAGVTNEIDEDVVRRMAGVTDRSYLFRISDAVAARDGATALAELAELRQRSVDVKRLTEELIAHYRCLMLATLPGGKALLSGVSPDEEQLYLAKGPQLGQIEAIRAIRALGNAMERMTRGNDQRIELELALFSLTEPAQTAAQQLVAPAPQPTNTASAAAAPRPFAAAPKPFARGPVQTETPAAQPQEAQITPAQPPKAEPPVAASEAPEAHLPWEDAPAAPIAPIEPAPSVPAPAPDAPISQEVPPPWEDAPNEAPPLPDDPPPPPLSDELPPAAAVPARSEPTPQPAAAYPADPTLGQARKVAQPGVNPYPQWSAVVDRIRDSDPMLYSYLKKSKAYFDGTRVLIDGGRVFRDFIRANKLSQQRIKKVIAEVSGISVPIGPYEPKAAKADAPAGDAEQSLHALEALGLEVHISDTEKTSRKK
jgi:DNA polymerase-3 subunit gamma/tau